MASWVLPGLGHALVGQRARGLVLGVTILSLWSAGLMRVLVYLHSGRWAGWKENWGGHADVMRSGSHSFKAFFKSRLIQSLLTSCSLSPPRPILSLSLALTFSLSLFVALALSLSLFFSSASSICVCLAL